jgi:hypothetical protein
MNRRIATQREENTNREGGVGNGYKTTHCTIRDRVERRAEGVTYLWRIDAMQCEMTECWMFLLGL